MKELVSMREELLVLKKELTDELKEINESIKKLEGKILTTIQQFGADRVVVDDKRYEVFDDVVFNATDWDEFYNYIFENKAAFLLQKRLSTKALDELLELDELPPGVEPVMLTKLRVVKV